MTIDREPKNIKPAMIPPLSIPRFRLCSRNVESHHGDFTTEETSRTSTGSVATWLGSSSGSCDYPSSCIARLPISVSDLQCVYNMIDWLTPMGFKQFRNSSVQSWQSNDCSVSTHLGSGLMHCRLRLLRMYCNSISLTRGCSGTWCRRIRRG